MATPGNKNLHEGIPEIGDAFVVIVKTEWNAHIVDELERGCSGILGASNIRTETIVVPGAFELPFAVKAHSLSNNTADAYIVLGAVVRGDTPHFDYVCNGVTNGIMQLNITLISPVIFGILTVDNEQQALERIGGTHGHKGEEAGITAIKMINLKRRMK